MLNFLIRLWKRFRFKKTASGDLDVLTKASLARQLKENPLFDVMLKDIEDEITDYWKNSPAGDKEGREVLYMRMEAIRKISSMVDGYIDTALYEQKIKGQGSSQPEQKE